MNMETRITEQVKSQLQIGDLVRVDLDPVVGSETTKRRPCMVVSHQQLNAVSKTVTVIPISHGTGSIMRICPKISPAQNDANIDGAIVVPQIVSLDLVARKATLLGSITDPELTLQVKRTIAAALDIGLATFN